jgi:hypothetical protein
MIENQIKMEHDMWPEHFLARLFSQPAKPQQIKEVITRLIQLVVSPGSKETAAEFWKTHL